jgi:hypothetical protein
MDLKKSARRGVSALLAAVIMTAPLHAADLEMAKKELRHVVVSGCAEPCGRAFVYAAAGNTESQRLYERSIDRQSQLYKSAE